VQQAFYSDLILLHLYFCTCLTDLPTANVHVQGICVSS
jgi:hypothetical protein